MYFSRKTVTLLYTQPFYISILHFTMISSLITLLSMPGGSEWIIIALVVLLLFGGKKIPELMKGMGKGVRSFKEGMNEVSNELKDASDKTNENSSENSSK